MGPEQCGACAVFGGAERGDTCRWVAKLLLDEVSRPDVLGLRQTGTGAHVPDGPALLAMRGDGEELGAAGTATTGEVDLEGLRQGDDYLIGIGGLRLGPTRVV